MPEAGPTLLPKPKCYQDRAVLSLDIGCSRIWGDSNPKTFSMEFTTSGNKEKLEKMRSVKCPPCEYPPTCAHAYQPMCTPVHMHTFPPGYLSMCTPVHIPSSSHACLCTCVTVQVCTGVHAYQSMCVPVHTCTCACAYLSKFISLHVCTCAYDYQYTCICPGVYLGTCIPVHVHTCACAHIPTKEK